VRALRHCGLPAISRSSATPAPLFGRGPAVVTPYVDNANFFAGSKQLAAAAWETYKVEFTSLGLTVRKEVPAEHMEMADRRFIWQRRVLLPHVRRAWRLWYGLNEDIRLRALLPSQVRRRLGRLVDRFAARRESLCVLHAA